MVAEIRRVVSAKDEPVLFEALMHSYRRDSAERDPGDPIPGPAEIEAEFFRATPVVPPWFLLPSMAEGRLATLT